jgi:hypothetical protein
VSLLMEAINLSLLSLNSAAAASCFLSNTPMRRQYDLHLVLVLRQLHKGEVRQTGRQD